MPSGIYVRKLIPAEDRFHKKYVVDVETGCWEWSGTTGTFGYGAFSINNGTMKAHRYSYELHYGSIPKGMKVCHTCDNPSCVNPEHLFLGTQSDNMKDMLNKDRSGAAKLTIQLVSEILMWLKLGYTVVDIAASYNVSYSAISHIKNGRSWRQCNG